MNKEYARKVEILLRIIPLFTDEGVFAVHGGSAINLFVQRDVLENQFDGMTDIPFSYGEFEATRAKLIKDVNAILTPDDKAFLLSFERAEPDWDKFEFAYFQNYPSVRWKLQNLENLKAHNHSKLQEEADKLEKICQTPS